LIYWFSHFLLSRFLRIFYGFKVIGLENFPIDGPVLVASNHRSNMDPVAVGCALRREIHYLAKEELFKIPILNWIIRQWKAFPIKRGGADRQAIKTALGILQQGKVVGVFPEGTRSKTGELGQPQSGVGLLAIKGNCLVVPLVLLGTQKLFGPITVKIGQPLDFSRKEGERVKAEEVSRQIMEGIAKLLEG